MRHIARATLNCQSYTYISFHSRPSSSLLLSVCWAMRFNNKNVCRFFLCASCNRDEKIQGSFCPRDMYAHPYSIGRSSSAPNIISSLFCSPCKYTQQSEKLRCYSDVEICERSFPMLSMCSGFITAPFTFFPSADNLDLENKVSNLHKNIIWIIIMAVQNVPGVNVCKLSQ